MALFCPLCHCILYIESREPGKTTFVCLGCNYSWVSNFTFYKSTTYSITRPESVSLSSGNEFEHAPKISAICPECHNGEAYFMSLQTRSADEPMTQFFACTKCLNRWKE
ncbi:bifunctional DNA-directed RNA polymerase subunit-transcription factor S/Pol III subunit C11 [Babesia duncani]|uniref:DNA-directed RNA polymerase subunit n=1 Tax=Babesia duncani TaxID=323732 RepID=A0AAD9PP52_9APIC|nr:bifunctional DNA-directed RNA polymerase subunit-transcription factor S/Pol III subunit C11 [Babesia duncani]